MELGIYGSPAHVLTNKKVVDKKDCFKEMNIQGLKDTGKMFAVPAGLAGAAAGATIVADKFVPEQTKKVTSKIAPTVQKIVNKLGVADKFNALPKPVKAAITVGAAALAVAIPVMTVASISHMGKIEGQHEVQ